MDILKRLFARARKARRRTALPEVDDQRIREAARQLKDEGIAEPVFPDPGRAEHYASLYPGNRKIALRAVRKPLIHACMMVKAGDRPTLAP